MEDKKVTEGKVNLLDYAVVFLKRKKLIFGIATGLGALALLACLIMDPVYEGKAQILPPAQSSGTSMALQMLSQIGGLSGGATALGVTPSTTLYINMIKSRTVYDAMIDKFNLMVLYKPKLTSLFLPFTRQDCRDALEKHIDIEDVSAVMISIAVNDKDPKRAAEMANAFVDELKRMNNGVAITEASQRRLFYEEQLAAAKVSLANAEESMKAFQEKTGMLDVDSQAKAVVQGIAYANAEIASKQVEINVLRTYSTPNNPDLQKAEDTLKGLKAELAKLEANNGSGHDPFMPTGRIPSVGVEYVRKFRELKFNTALHDLLKQQMEAAKLDEAKDATVMQVIDRAVPNSQAVKPRTVIIVVAVFLLGFFMATILAFFLEYWQNMSVDEENRDRLDLVKKYCGCGFIKKYTASGRSEGR